MSDIGADGTCGLFTSGGGGGGVGSAIDTPGCMFAIAAILFRDILTPEHCCPIQASTKLGLLGLKYWTH